MNLWESLKKPFISEPQEINPSNTTSDLRKIKTLSDEGSDYEGVMAFSNTNGEMDLLFSGTENITLLQFQNKVIESYRNLAKNSDVDYAIDLLINEMAFTVDDEEFKIDIDEENNTIKKAIGDTFSSILKKINNTKNIHAICRQLYIDGQLNVNLVYDTSNLKDGIKEIKLLEPIDLYFDKDNKLWKYSKQNVNNFLYTIDDDKYDQEYTTDEVIHIDYGLYSKIVLGHGLRGTINLGYLENVFKVANQLTTLENMLVPMRYSRSVSRRMFNIDVADLPPKKAKELMNTIRNEFKYKKVYDTETGTIKNMQSTQPLVEDYWLSNRSGNRGTTVDLMDERGSAMDLDDIIYTSKKLFTSMKVPVNRNPYADEDGGNFSFDTQDTTNQDMMFYLHVDRLRIPVIELFKELLKKEIIATGIMSQEEWDKYKDKINIQFASKSIFLENMQKDLFLKAIDNYSQFKDEVGVVVSLETALQNTFGWTNEQVQEELEKIKGERNNPLYTAFYSAQEENGF